MDIQVQINKVRQWANYTEPEDAEILEAAAKSLESLQHILASEASNAKAQRKKVPAHPFWTKYVEAHKVFLQNKRIVQRMNIAEGKALKEIIAYLEEYTAGDQERAYGAWLLIFRRWELLNDFLKSQNTLISINKYLQEIITKLTHGTNSKQKNQQGVDDLASRIRERRASATTTS